MIYYNNNHMANDDEQREMCNMGLFSSNYNRPGPGVPKDAPAKKGIPRFFEIFIRDFGMLWRANFITMLCFIPCFIALIIGQAFSEYIGMVLICSLVFVLGCCLAGPALTALFGVTVKSVRDIPGYMWHDYKKYFASNIKQSIPAGIISMVLIAMDFIMVNFYLTQEGNSRYVLLALVFFGVIVITGCSIYCFLQILFIDLPLPAILKNSLMLMFGYVKRSLPATLIGIVFLVAMLGVISWPFAIMLAFFFGLPVFVLVIICMWTWPIMDKTFNITQLQKDKEERENATNIEKE
ncbi:MAG: hypothetical protein GXZ14_06795 [Ruminococcaceae bacterium]|nr:hypothetical protein [Oscillospiraceae bacterium]